LLELELELELELVLVLVLVLVVRQAQLQIQQIAPAPSIHNSAAPLAASCAPADDVRNHHPSSDMRRLILKVLLLIALPALDVVAQPSDSVLARGLVFRGIGPALMGGRITEITVAERGRLGTVIYIAAATGGVWRSTNAGVSWTSLFDSVRAPSFGAVAVAASNPDVLWVGTGEPQNMRSSSWGNGVYKSMDGGRTWSAPMLPKSQHIGRIVIDPRDPDVVYVAAVGPLWAPGGERGLFKTTDGGRTWTNTKGSASTRDSPRSSWTR
jgi:hypothetical protein